MKLGMYVIGGHPHFLPL